MSQASGSDFNVATLRAISLFEGLATPQFEALAANMLMRRLLKKELLFTEGEKGTQCFFIAQGLCALIKGYQTRQPVCVELVSAGDPVGVAAVLDDIEFPMTLKTIQESVAVCFPKDFFIQMLNHDRQLEQRFLRLTRERFRHVQTRFHQIAGSDAKHKILATLSMIIDRLNISHFPGELNLSKTELAELASVEPETLIRFSSSPLGRTILSTIKRGHLTILKSPQEFLQ